MHVRSPECRVRTNPRIVGNGRRIAWGIVAVVLAPLGAIARTADLPTTAHVHFERLRAGVLVLEPAPNVLVLAERINVCDRSKWFIGEASTTGIDSYLVRTDKSGAFHVPPRRYDQVCSRVALTGTAYVPGYESIVARAYFATQADSTKPAYALMDKDNDVLLRKGRPISPDTTVVGFSRSFGSKVTLPMIRQIFREMRPDLELLLTLPAGGKESPTARDLRVGLQESYVLSDWMTIKAKEQIQLIDLMINDYGSYNLTAKPSQSTQYYVNELQRIVEHYGGTQLPKVLGESTVFDLLEGLATLDGDWRHNWSGPPLSTLEYSKKILGSNFDEFREVFPEKYERLERP